MTTTHYIALLTLRAAALVPMYTFLIGCFCLWRQTYLISLGHKYSGKVAMIILFIFDATYTIYPEYGMNLRPFVNAALTVWVVYNSYFFYRYPIPWKYLQAGSGAVQREHEYVPKFKLEQILVTPPRKKSIFFTGSFTLIAFGVVFILMIAFFFRNYVQLAVESDRRVIQAQRETQNKVSQTARNVSSEIKQTVAVAVKTLGTVQAKQSAKTDSALSQLEGQVNKPKQPVPRKAPDRPLIIFQPAPKTDIPQPSFTLPTEIKPPPVPPRRGRKYGRLFDLDSTGWEIARSKPE